MSQPTDHTLKQRTNSITVVHLVWLPYGVELFNSFIESYIRHPAGAAHNLLILFNGVKEESDTNAYHALISKYPIEYTSMYHPGGQDIDAYFWLAGKVSSGHLIFLNSFSVIQTDNWLLKFVNAVNEPGTGAVAATASLQSPYSLVFEKHTLGYESEKGFLVNFRKYKLMLKAFFYWRFLFKPFPNPHLRTNAFMIGRELFLSVHKPVIKNKMDAYRFESGRNSMTAQLLKKGLDVLVVDKNGKTYKMHDWKLSKTFWSGNQENLMISDNQTRMYENASNAEKEFLCKSAWGVHE